MKSNYYDFGRYSIEVINNPKINIEKYSIERLITECTELSRNSFGSQDISKDLIRYHILETSTTILGRDNFGKVFGFGSSRIIIIDKFYIIYFQCIVISNEYKQNGFHKIFIPLRIIEGIKYIKEIDKFFDKNNVLIGARTQNPLAYRTSNKLVGLFPNPNGFIDERIREVGRKFAKSLYNDDCSHNNFVKPFVFDDKTFVVKSAYRYGINNESKEIDLYKSRIPFCHDIEINNYMRENLDWKNGDALILLGYYNSEKVKKLLRSYRQVTFNRFVADSADNSLTV